MNDGKSKRTFNMPGHQHTGGSGKDKKRYLQSCGLDGGLYGKKRTTNRTTPQAKRDQTPEDGVTSYSKLYKRQYMIMDKIFRKNT